MNNKGLFATKPIADYQQEAASKHLVRALGIPALIAFGIGGIIGFGIFVLTGVAAAQARRSRHQSFRSSSPASAACSPVCASPNSRPGAGCRVTLVPAATPPSGEIVAWFVGWNLVLEYMMAYSTVAVGWSRYFVKVVDHYGVNFIPSALQLGAFCGCRDRISGPSNRRFPQSAGDRHRARGDCALLQGHQRVGRGQHRDRRDQGQHRGGRDRVRRLLR